MRRLRKSMPDNLETYLKNYGKYSFVERAFNEVDSLILCQLTYLRFDGLVPGIREKEGFVKLSEVAAKENQNRLVDHILFAETNRKLLGQVLAAKRFSELKLNCFVNLVEKAWETQFAAITYLLDNGRIFIAFRGTDETLVGWKEDFNMAFLSPVPGQSFSVKYVHMVTEQFSGPFYLGGHSKGGNLALYSAMYCREPVQKRILRVYNLDGPGFPPEFYLKEKYEKIADRTVKIVPCCSLVGMLFEKEGRCRPDALNPRASSYQVVQSKGFGIAQHNALYWKIRGNHFVTGKDFTKSTKRTNRQLNAWILSMNRNQRKQLVDRIYQGISGVGVDKITDVWANRKKVVSCLPRVTGMLWQALQKKR